MNVVAMKMLYPKPSSVGSEPKQRFDIMFAAEKKWNKANIDIIISCF